jgi:hypothetical protein
MECSADPFGFALAHRCAVVVALANGDGLHGFRLKEREEQPQGTGAVGFHRNFERAGREKRTTVK